MRMRKVYPCLEAKVLLCRRCARDPLGSLPEYERENLKLLLRVLKG